MKKSVLIPFSAIAILAVVVVVGASTKSQPLPVAALSVSVERFEVEDPNVAVQKKAASMDHAFEQQTQAADTALDHATQNTLAYSPAEYDETVALVKEKMQEEAAQKTIDKPVQKKQIEPVQKVVAKKEPQEKRVQEKPVQEEVVQNHTITLTVVGGGSYTASVPAGSTVQAVMASSGINFSSKEYAGMGAYVTAIEGVSEDTRAGLYWILYINGAKAQAGISATTVQAGDTILWRLEPGQ